MIVLKLVALWLAGNAALVVWLVARYAWFEWRAARAFEDAQGRKRVGL